MKTIKNIIIGAFAMLSISACNAQIKNKKTETVKIYGNCGMCKQTIEKAGNSKKQAEVVWDKKIKIASIVYDSTKTSKEEILKRIALAGYDNELFLAPTNAYDNLHSCCQYERPKNSSTTTLEQGNRNIDTVRKRDTVMVIQTESNALLAVFDNYFSVKDALVQTNGAKASEKSKALLTAINAVEMDKLSMDVHMVWMKVLADLKEDANHIASSKDASHQRGHFINLSKNMFTLMKVSKYEQPVYYQFCPMANNGKGAHWLSKENTIKNPYFGSQMLNCGKTVETIK